MPKIPVIISNIKISVKLKSISPNTLKNLCKVSNVSFKEVSNFIIFKLKDEKNCERTYSIFKPNSDNQKEVHVNICGIKEGQIEESIKQLQKFLEYPLENIPYKIDTITGSVKLGHKINLRNFLHKNQGDRDNKIKFNPEIFPALFITRDKITYAVFSSGSVNTIGTKSREDIESKINYILEKCMESASKKLIT